MSDPYDVAEKRDKDGNEKEFSTFVELELERCSIARRNALQKTNAHIRLRNEVRKLKNEMTAKALEMFSSTISIPEVSAELYKMIEANGLEDPLAIIDFIEETVIFPLEKEGLIELSGFSDIPGTG